MKILLCHNFYQRPGGEDKVFADEAALLESHGHQVIRYHRHNDDLDAMGNFEKLRRTLSNPRTMTDLIEVERPDVMHCHNTFPLISPSVYEAANAMNVPVVQTLHNYRLLCPGAVMLREGRVCEACLGRRVAWPAVLHGCYRDSRSASAAVSAMLALHRTKGTWTGKVDRYIALTEFSRRKFIEGGLPEEKITVKPNFVGSDPGAGRGSGGYAVFVGRLSPEKGIETLLEAWRRMPSGPELKIIGDGPLADTVTEAAAADKRIEWRGHRPEEEVHKLIGDAGFLVMPSVWNEMFGLSVIEAYAAGTPVIASRIGSLADMVKENETGFLFEPGNADDLARTVRDAASKPRRLQAMRKAARVEFERKYSAGTNYEQLVGIYHDAIQGYSQ